MNDLQGYSSDHRTLDKLIDGVNITTNDKHMWLIPFIPGKDHFINFDFKSEKIVSGLRIWNYNKCINDVGRGTKIITI